MSRVITFSRTFPTYHTRVGQPTYFIEQIWSELGIKDASNNIAYDRLMSLNPGKEKDARLVFHSLTQPFNFVGNKKHTIRSGKRYKAGDYFSPRVWSGKPYTTPQVIIAPDILVKKTFDFEFKINNELRNIFTIDGKEYLCDYRKYGHAHHLLFEISENDGLNIDDFMCWFKYPNTFSGQIICWADVNY